MDSYGDYHKCPNHEEVLSAAHGETCPECGWPTASTEETDL